jgi:DNA-binding transcriptional LysR family regulator
MLTLRQIEVIRAVMINGTLAGAAKQLGVSAPGISRLMKYTEQSLRLKIFERVNNRYLPTPEAEDIFEQINGVYKKVDDLHFVLERIDRGVGLEFRLGSVPSISHFMVPRALKRVRDRFPDIWLDFDIIKVQEAQDFLLLGKGEVAVLSYSISHPGLELIPLPPGEWHCIVPHGHPLAAADIVSAAQIARYPIAGVLPEDPYGGNATEVFRQNGIPFQMIMNVRFGVTTIGLVRAGLGISIIDQFAAPLGSELGVKILRIREATHFQAFVAKRANRPLSRPAEAFVETLQEEMQAALRPSPR